MISEEERLAFVAKRDGFDASLKFACQGIGIYINASVDQSKYKGSLETYKKFLRENGYEVKLVISKGEDIKKYSIGKDK